MITLNYEQRSHQIGLQAMFTVVVLAGYLVVAATSDIIPMPTDIGRAFQIQIAQGELIEATAAALYAIFIGYFLAILIGIPVGVIMGTSSTLEEFLDVYVDMLYSLPLAAIVPAFILWFGTGVQTRVAGVFFFAVFPILINTMKGAKNAPVELMEAGRSFGASRFFLITRVIIPYEATYIATGLRLGINLAVKGLVVVELIVAVTGFGGLIFQWGSALQLEGVFSVILVLIAMGLILTWVLKQIEERLIHWNVAEQ